MLLIGPVAPGRYGEPPPLGDLDRNGNLKDTQGLVFGTVNYATGVLRFLPDTTVRIPVARYLVTQIGSTRIADGTLSPLTGPISTRLPSSTIFWVRR